ncbi:cytochrome c1 [Pseudorhodoplanes sinuspersici]|uniref:Cytochrome c1 n=1 Tax=Pseudorhodoplanes sinuspersici TaxID=1235591 RepID=A0A1W6ZJZ1_9HYPH|nr:cytochrome c1 [Pseudorhodoplanes sinuspersici]
MTMQRSFIALALVLGMAAPAIAAEGQEQPPKQSWSFSGPVGKFDRAQLQRGFKVYREVCQACHSLSLISFRNLAEPGGPGFSTAQAAAVAAEYKIQDGPNDAGEMFERPGRLADRFPKPFANDNAARAANGGALPPDLSLIAKARTYERGGLWFLLDLVTQYQEQGPDYIDALLQGYTEAPKDFTLPEGTSYNKYFPGHAIGMPAPLSDGQVTYDDGSPQTLAQYSKDVTAFLMWAAEPHMEARKRLGIQVMIFLLIFAGLLYFTKKKVWAAVKEHPELLEGQRAPTEYKGRT